MKKQNNILQEGSVNFMQVRKTLVLSMQALKKEVIDMAELTLDNIKKAFHAFQEADQVAAKNTLKLDDAVDAAEEAIAKHALQVIWREQPVASDLRLVTGILKMITDIERIGDHACDVAYMTTNINAKPNAHVLSLATKLMNNLEAMYKMTIEALELNNEALAQKVIEEDEQINLVYKEALSKITDMLKKDQIEAEEAVYSLMILKYLEKIGDHATNIAEWIIFTLTGIHKKTELY